VRFDAIGVSEDIGMDAINRLSEGPGTDWVGIRGSGRIVFLTGCGLATILRLRLGRHLGAYDLRIYGENELIALPPSPGIVSADDFVVIVRGERHHAEALREEVAAVLAPLGLRLAQEKTRVVHIDEGFDFLGYTLRRQRKRGTQKYYVYTKPSRKAIQSIKDKVSAKTYRSTQNQELDVLITSINRSLTGWANYFRPGVSKATFNSVDHHAWGRLMRWTRRKYAGRTGLRMKPLRDRFCDRGWNFAHNGVVFTGASSVTVEYYRWRGSKIPTPWPPLPAAAATG
jgi:RNA-directed DNA polymerase